jgi:ABC-type spermidine/putrescine transport system permease subunit I
VSAGYPATEEAVPALRARRLPAGLLTALVVGPPLLYLLILYVIPMFGMLAYSFGSSNGVETQLTWDLDQYRRLFGSPAIIELLLKSLRMAGIVTLACLVIGFPIAYILARSVPKRFQYILLLLLLVPSWTSFIVRTYSWILVLGNQGLVNATLERAGLINKPAQLAFNEFAVDLALVYMNLPWLVLPVYVALEKIDPALLEAGGSLGASKLQLFRRVILPLSLPGVVAGVLLVFIPAISTFAVPEILGGTGGIMYASLINDYFLNFDWPFGAALATTMLALTLAAVALAARMIRLESLWTR